MNRPPSPRCRRWASCAALAVASLVYAAATVPNLDLPGLHYDEAYDASLAVEMLKGQPLQGAHSSISLGGREWPLMSTPIEAATTAYLTAIPFRLFGISVETLRLWWLAMGLATLVLLWFLARDWFGPSTAAIAALLCGTSPVFAWWFRAGDRWEAQLLPLALCMIWTLRRGWERGDLRLLAAGAFLFGLGVSTKILFLWLLAPIAVAGWVSRGEFPRRRDGRDLSGRVLATIACALLAGLAPLVIDNARDPGLLRFLRANAFETQLYGHDNLAFWSNLRAQVEDLARILGGDTLVFPPRMASPLGLVLLVFAVGGTTLRFARGASDPRRAVVGRLYLLLTVVLVVPLSTISTSGIGGSYLFIIVPFVWLLIAVALRDAAVWLSARLRPPRAELVLLTTVLAVVALHALVHVRIQAALVRTGGLGLWSDAIAELARVLERDYAGRTIVAMDWGFARNLEVLTEGRLRPREAYELRPEPSPALVATCAELLAESSNVYLFHVPRHTAFRGVREVFARVAEESGRTLRAERELRDREGSAVVQILVADGPESLRGPQGGEASAAGE